MRENALLSGVSGSIVGWGKQVAGGDLTKGFVAVETGVRHSLGLKKDGSIVAWGDNNDGLCNVPAPNSGFVAVAAAELHNLGLKEDGSIVGWGRNDHVGNYCGQCDVPAPNTGFVSIAAGCDYSLGLKADGSIVAWGWNGYGQCSVPAPNTGFVAVSAGDFHCLGLKSDGSIVAWGGNDYGQCDVLTSNTVFVSVAAGQVVSLGLKADGSIVAWGWNGYGQCSVPAPNTGFVSVSAGDSHCLGLKADGSIVAWGENPYGQCDVPAPNAGFVSVAAGYLHSLGLKADGSIVAWGDNGAGVCNVPAPNTGFVSVAAGPWHFLGLKADGSIVAWGDTAYGACDVPAPNTGFISVAAGSFHSLGLKSNGSIMAWGGNDYGQCDVPAPNSNFVAVAAWYCHSLGLKSDGSIVAWGLNVNGQCNVPTPNSGFVAVTAGQLVSLGLKSDGSIVAWGDNRYDQCNIPAPNSGFVAITAGYLHCLGLKSDGSIVAWGTNGYGGCDVPAPNNGFVAVAAGLYHSLGLKADGSIVAWGGNFYGECNVPAPNSGFVAIAASMYWSSLAIRRADEFDPPPYVTEAIYNDDDNDGVVEAGESLTLVMNRDVLLTNLSSAACFYLPVSGDSLGGTGFGVHAAPQNSSQIIVTLGEGANLTVGGTFDMQQLTPGSPSGIDISTSLTSGTILSLTGKNAVDGGVEGLDDSGIDIFFTFLAGSATIGASGGSVQVQASPNAAYTQHALYIPAGALTGDQTFTLRPPENNGGVLGAVQIDVVGAGAGGIKPGAMGNSEASGKSREGAWQDGLKPALQTLFAVPIELQLEYHESDIDREKGQVEPAMKVQQLVENPAGVFRWGIVPGPHHVHTQNNTVSVDLLSLNPLDSLGTAHVFAALPGLTVETVTSCIKPQPGASVALQPGSQGDYPRHRVEIPNYIATTPDDPDRITLTVSQPTLLHRVSVSGTSFPAASCALFVVTTRNAGDAPVAFTSPVNVRVQFMNGTVNAYNDLVDFHGAGGEAWKMRVVRGICAGPSVDFAFLDRGVRQTVNTAAGTVEAFGVTGLTDATGEGVWGAVVNSQIQPTAARCWEIYE
jgi:alpha-tubulin suppressor-like RCC1 family protein